MRVFVAGFEEHWRCLRTSSNNIPDNDYAMLCFLLMVKYEHYYKELEKVSKEKEVKLFLDSGAFSAWTKGIQINIDEYIAFIKKWKKYIEVYANLDVIGDAEGTYKNQKYMEKRGLKPLPVFHLQDDFSWLEKYLKEGYDYIGIGGMAGKQTVGNRKYFLDRLWDRITDKNGYPIIKAHGFGMTSINLIVKFPWYSVDSTSWLNASRMGNILVPKSSKDGYVYTQKPLSVAVSDKSPLVKDFGKHFTSFTEQEKKYVKNYLKTIGVTLKEVTEDYKIRDRVCVLFFQRLQDALPKWPWAMKKGNIRRSFL
jgi:hypothetical protein